MKTTRPLGRLVPAALALATLTLAAPSTFAATETWNIDAVHSDFSFRISHMVVSRVGGKFGKFSGTFHLDRESSAASKVDIKIEATSIDTASEGRDKDLRSANFFDVTKYPEITFRSTKIVDKGSGLFDVTGDLTMKGVAKPITLTVRHNGFIKDPWGLERTGFEVTGRLDRKDYGITYNKALDSGGMIVGDAVDLSINIEATKAKPEAKK